MKIFSCMFHIRRKIIKWHIVFLKIELEDHFVSNLFKHQEKISRRDPDDLESHSGVLATETKDEGAASENLTWAQERPPKTYILTVVVSLDVVRQSCWKNLCKTNKKVVFREIS